MRYIRAALGGEVFYAALREGQAFRLNRSPIGTAAEETGDVYPLSSLRLLAPCEPTKIVCVGKNYMDHIKEAADGSSEVPEAPTLFIKPNTCVCAPEGDIVYPACSERVDYEAELAVVIGRRAHDIPAGHAKEYIFGYTCLNDVTARDIQQREGQWTRSKSFDTFCPIGPWIETELDAQHTQVVSRLNGEVCQNSDTSMMIHSIDKLLCVMSECMTLLPGDVIATGTPAGIGPMKRGDVIEIQIGGVGVLRNKVV